MYEGGSWSAWFVGLVAGGVTPVLLLVFAVLCFLRAAHPRLGGLKLLGAGLAVWAATDLLSWPIQSRLVYDNVYAISPWLGSNYAAISSLIGTLIAAVCWGLGGYGALRVAGDLAEAPAAS